MNNPPLLYQLYECFFLTPIVLKFSEVAGYIFESSMAARATFTGFDPYRLNGVIVTQRVLGHGSYATVLELEYKGLKCAGKKIHEVLLEQGAEHYSVRRFEEECRLLSNVRHPNIVQFLGVHFQRGVPAPILVMEFLPTNLTSCITQYKILPNEISYSILHDVVLGLYYLHSQTPPIIHRDLSANNVLLASNMTAKISDLGVARMLNLTPLQVSRMTETPGTPAYMPPEVMQANPKYDTSLDEFSYGILMIHVFSGRWPEPQEGQTRIENRQLVPVTEAERREVFLRAIGNDHPLMDLIMRCINNDSSRRAHASEIVERLSGMVLQFPASFANRLEMLRSIEHQEQESKKASFKWKQCKDLPIKLSFLKSTIINGKVYCGGGQSDKDYDSDDGEYNIYCYDPSQDNWTTLPPLPVRYFGLGQVNGELVAVGGWKKSTYGVTNEVFTYNVPLSQWMGRIPSMLTARYSPGVLSLQSALVVAGGGTSDKEYTDAVEIFKADTSQWYRTDPLPTACCFISLVIICNTCYALGGYMYPSYLNQTFCSSVDDLFRNAVRADQTPSSGSSLSAWKTLANSPTYGPSAAMLAGNLITIGGTEAILYKKEVYMFSPSTNSWIHISDLPEPRLYAAVAVLSSTEILVIGGSCDGRHVNSTYKGTLQALWFDS